MSEPTYSGEVQFAGYADSSRSGPRVTLRLSDRADLDRFVGCEGKRFMLALVEIGDDEQPATDSKAMGPLCRWAVMRDKDPMFQRWVPAGRSPRDYILEVCEVDSRKDLDTDELAKARFNKLIRSAYTAWLERQGAA